MAVDESSSIQVRQNHGIVPIMQSKGISDAFVTNQKHHRHQKSDIDVEMTMSQGKTKLNNFMPKEGVENCSHENAPPRRNRNNAPFSL